MFGNISTVKRNILNMPKSEPYCKKGLYISHLFGRKGSRPSQSLRSFNFEMINQIKHGHGFLGLFSMENPFRCTQQACSNWAMDNSTS